jgi:hypothetical protein
MMQCLHHHAPAQTTDFISKVATTAGDHDSVNFCYQEIRIGLRQEGLKFEQLRMLEVLGNVTAEYRKTRVSVS